ncbi:MAG: hypothetical protein AAF578_00285 [Pseudomonadota bacterium]
MAKLADGSAATSAGMGVIAVFSNLEPIVTGIAGLVGIAAGVFAALYHYEKWRAMRDSRRGK